MLWIRKDGLHSFTPSAEIRCHGLTLTTHCRLQERGARAFANSSTASAQTLLLLNTLLRCTMHRRITSSTLSQLRQCQNKCKSFRWVQGRPATTRANTTLRPCLKRSNSVQHNRRSRPGDRSDHGKNTENDWRSPPKPRFWRVHRLRTKLLLVPFVVGGAGGEAQTCSMKAGKLA